MLERKKDYKAWLYLAIPLFLLSVFTFYPLLKTVLISFFSQYNSVKDDFGSFFDLAAYIAIFKGGYYLKALLNTLIITVISVPVSTIIALLIAVALNSIKPLQKIFQTIFFIPYVTNTLAIGMVFNTMFSHTFAGGITQDGLINSIFGLNTNWVGPSASAEHWLFVVLIYTIWNGLPFKILVFIGGLQSISKQYYDAAKIDSTPSIRVLRRITIPLLSPMISYILITSLIGSFKSYEAVLSVASVSGALPFDRFTAVAYVYDTIGNTGMDSNYVSYYSRGAAGAVVLFLIIMAFTAINLKISSKRVHY